MNSRIQRGAHTPSRNTKIQGKKYKRPFPKIIHFFFFCFYDLTAQRTLNENE